MKNEQQRSQLALPLAASPASLASSPRASANKRDTLGIHEMHRHHHLIAYAIPARS